MVGSGEVKIRSEMIVSGEEKKIEEEKENRDLFGNKVGGE